MDQLRFEVPGEYRYFLMSKTKESDVALGFYSPEDGGWLFQVKEATGNFIINKGNVGIGLTTPTEKLVVDGKICATEVKVSTVPCSDYVFEPDYPLLPLSEVESHIKEKKHLPGIPSAEQFKENGVGLGEMDDMLLRKVEELTLYMIELKKENEELKNEIIELKSSINNED